MNEEVIIKVDKVSKVFKLPHDKNTSIKGAVINFYSRKRSFEKQQALKSVSFEVKKGEFFGIVGRNGSGKSTLLKLLAGIYSPTGGTVNIKGKLTPFIELGVGFSPELSGRENVFLNGALLGFSRKEMNKLYPEIVEFAELERFMDQKLKNYSSGMQVRLAFSIAIRAQSDILLLDEVLAVGDAAFQKKCYDYFMQLKKDKQTVVLVTHDMSAIRQYCDAAIMINDGEVVAEGLPEKIALAYQRLFSKEFEISINKKGASPDSNIWGSGLLKAQSVELHKSKEQLLLSTTYLATSDIPAPIFGFTVFDSKGMNIIESNTQRLGFKTQNIAKGQRVSMCWVIPNILKNGQYSIRIACCDQSAVEYYESFDDAASFRIDKKTSTAGIVDPKLNIKDYKLEKDL